MRQALFRLQQEGYVEVLFRSGWRVLAFNFEKFVPLYDLRMVLETAAIDRLAEDPFQTQDGPSCVVRHWLVSTTKRSSATPDLLPDSRHSGLAR